MPKESIKKKLQTIAKENPPKSNFTKVAAQAMVKAGFEKVVVFDFYSPKLEKFQLVMINLIASDSELETGCVCNAEGDIIEFKNSNDDKSISVDANARYLIFDSVRDEPTVLRLKSDSKTECTWIIHRVHDGKHKIYPKNFCNIHSHGMEVYNHKNFQVVLDVGDEIACYIINSLCERVREGHTQGVSMGSGDVITGIYSQFPLKLVQASEGGRSVLRVLLPDDEGRFPGEKGCMAPYSDQLIKFND